MSKEQPQQQFSIFDFLVFVGFITVMFSGWQWMHNKSIISDLKKTAVYQEVIYVGNNTFIQCINGHNTVLRSTFLSGPQIFIAKNYTTPPLTNTPESCVVKLYNYEQKEKMENNKSMIQVN